MSRDNVLFADGYLSEFLRQQADKTLAQIAELPLSRLKEASTEELVEQLSTYATYDPPRLVGEPEVISTAEVRIDVTDEPGRDYSGRAITVPGLQVKIAAPYEGDGALFRFSSDNGFTSYPRALITGNDVLLTYERTDLNAEAVRAECARDVGLIDQWLTNVRGQVEQHNSVFREQVRRAIEARRVALNAKDAFVGALGLPLRRREDSEATRSVPLSRKRVSLQASSTTAPAEPPTPTEWVLSDGLYEEILGTLDNMTLAIERSPSTFKRMSEPELRDILLVQLNGRYEWDATGETFNGAGKTDILLTYEGRHAFVAECKFWKGRKSLTDTFDQLLSYLTWRDTKAAIIVFVRSAPLSSVVAQVAGIVEGHASYKRTLSPRSETSFRFVFSQRDDREREIDVAVMLYAVPAPEESESPN